MMTLKTWTNKLFTAVRWRQFSSLYCRERGLPNSTFYALSPESVQNTKYIPRKSLVAAIADQLVMTPAPMQYWFFILTFSSRKITNQNLQRYFQFVDVNMCTNTILIPDQHSLFRGLNAGLVPPSSDSITNSKVETLDQLIFLQNQRRSETEGSFGRAG